MSNHGVIYFPDGKPCPPVLTQDEVIQLLRLDTLNVRFPEQTLRRYRDQGLKAIQLSKGVFFRLESVLGWLEQQEAEVVR